MKKYLLLLLAAFALVACEDSLEQIDYSTLSTEELLQTGEGVDYLVSQASEIDFAALNERLKTEVLRGEVNILYCQREDGKWECAKMIGGCGLTYCVLMDDNTFRHCFQFDDSQWELAGKWYRTHNAYDNAVVEMVGKVVPWAKIVAQVDNVLICEDRDAKSRFLCYLSDSRDWVLNEYPLDYDDPEVIKKVALENYEKRYNK